MLSRFEKQVRPVEGMIQPKPGKSKGRRRKERPDEEENDTAEENNDISGIKIQVFETCRISAYFK